MSFFVVVIALAVAVVSGSNIVSVNEELGRITVLN